MKTWQRASIVLGIGIAFAIQGCAQQEIKGANTKRNSGSQTPTADASSAGGASDLGGNPSSQPSPSPTPDPFMQQQESIYGQATNPYGANQGQYGYPNNANAGGTGLNVGSIIGIFGNLLGSGGPLSNLFNGSNVGNSSSPAAAAATPAAAAAASGASGSCGCGG